jgi:hypothetical protein
MATVPRSEVHRLQDVLDADAAARIAAQAWVGQNTK